MFSFASTLEQASHHLLDSNHTQLRLFPSWGTCMSDHKHSSLTGSVADSIYASNAAWFMQDTGTTPDLFVAEDGQASLTGCLLVAGLKDPALMVV